MSDVNPRNDMRDLLQDPMYPPDYPASVAWVLRKLYAGRSLVEGYLFEGRFYADQLHTSELPATKERFYVDVPSGTAYRWNGEAYVTVSVQTGNDTAAVHYTSEARSPAQMAQARANMGAAAQADMLVVEAALQTISAKTASWDAKQDALTFDAQPVEGSMNPARSGGIFTWVKGLISGISLAWSGITGKPTTIGGYGITDAVQRIKVGSDGTPLTPTSGTLILPVPSDPNAVRFNSAQELSTAQMRMARQNIGVTTEQITARAGAVSAAWSDRMSDREKTVLLQRLVEYVREKEGIS